MANLNSNASSTETRSLIKNQNETVGGRRVWEFGFDDFAANDWLALGKWKTDIPCQWVEIKAGPLGYIAVETTAPDIARDQLSAIRLRPIG